MSTTTVTRDPSGPPPDLVELAERFITVCQSNDGTGYRNLCDASVVTWHNYDDREADADRTLATLAWLHRRVPDLRWQVLSIDATPRAAIVRSRMLGTAPGGPLDAPSCMILTFSPTGRIVRVDEYIDSAQVAVLTAVTPSPTARPEHTSG